MQIKFGIPFLLITCAPALAVEPTLYAQDRRESVRAVLLQSAMDRDARSGAATFDLERRGGDVFPEAGAAMGAHMPDSSASSAENARRLRSLSPEERRMLRRQIDEVGHDIYSPQR